MVEEFILYCKEKKYIDINIEKKLSENKIFGDINKVIPHHVVVETTYTCPLKCKHCLNDSGTHRTESLSSVNIVNIINKFSELGTREITLTGGEVTIRSDFKELVKLASSKFEVVHICTTGYLITEELIAELVKCCHKNIVWQISIDGNEKTHNDIRCNGTAYEKAINAIKIIKKHGYYVTIASTIHKENIDQMEVIYLNTKETGADSLRFGMIIEKGRAENSNLEVNNQFVKELDLIKCKYKDEKFLISENLASLRLESNIEQRKRGCNLGSRILTIQADGKVVTCPAFTLVLGNIYDTNLEEVLSNNKSMILSELRAPEESVCGECPSLGECIGCHAAPFHNKKGLCKWKIKNESVLNYFNK
ncbi:MAG: radical SAM/SPASM domain-containing protein [Sarcina sp.]